MESTQGGWQANLLARKFCQLLIAASTTWQNSKKKKSQGSGTKDKEENIVHSMSPDQRYSR
jgi:hypothetical protein